jgi:L-ascorbate metabolism protein UlaG (beta-lactamase superfamily)
MLRLGFHCVHALEWGEAVTLGTLRVTAVPGRHPHVLDQNGYLLEAEGRSLLFLADTARFADLDLALAKLPVRPEVLLVSCTGFTLRGYGRIVMDPREAAAVAAVVAAPDVVLMRSLSEERVAGLLGRIIVKSFVPKGQAMAEFVAELASLAPSIRVHALARGRAWSP